MMIHANHVLILVRVKSDGCWCWLWILLLDPPNSSVDHRRDQRSILLSKRSTPSTKERCLGGCAARDFLRCGAMAQRKEFLPQRSHVEGGKEEL